MSIHNLLHFLFFYSHWNTLFFISVSSHFREISPNKSFPFRIAQANVIENILQADITLRFERRLHGDAAPFDGPGDVLAHTFYPLTTVNGRQKSYIHFDSAEKWTAHSEAGIYINF